MEIHVERDHSAHLAEVNESLSSNSTKNPSINVRLRHVQLTHYDKLH